MTTRPPLGARPSYACTSGLTPHTIADRDPERARRLTQGLRPLEFQPPRQPAAATAAPAGVPGDAMPPRAPRNGYRRNAVFHIHGQFDWRILDRNQRAKLWSVAQAMERITKQKGDRNGCLGAIGLTVLNCLLYRFLNANSGRCDPSYDTLQKLTGLCRQSISSAIDRLEAAGLVAVTRRMMRFKERVVCALTGRQHEIVVVRQISNAYVLTDPARIAIPSRRPHGATKAVRAFPLRRMTDSLQTTLANLFRNIAKPSLPAREKLKQSARHPLASRYEVHARK